MKPRVIFLHGMKSGGTSLRYMLLDEYGYDAIAPVPMGKSQLEVEYPVLRGVDPLKYQHTIDAHQMMRYQVVMSHYDWQIVKRLPGWDVITLLRHPVAQIVSLYNFLMGAADFSNFKFTAPPFMDWVQGEGKVYLNGQTRLLSGHGQSNLGAALNNLKDARMRFGILENFGESVAHWNEQYGWSMTVEHRNESVHRIPMTDAVYGAVSLLQHQDMILYETAMEMFLKS